MKRFVFVLLTATLLISVFTVALPAPKAHAQPHALTVLDCVGTESLQYHPGVTNTPRPVTITATSTLGPCVVPLQPTLTGGTGGYTVTLTLSCTSLALPQYTETYHWNNNTQSVVSYTTTVVTRANGEIILESIGTVTSGFGLGSTADQILTFVNLDVTACASSQGLQSNAGPLSLTFV
jgi:hypothetical protein